MWEKVVKKIEKADKGNVMKQSPENEEKATIGAKAFRMYHGVAQEGGGTRRGKVRVLQ